MRFGFNDVIDRTRDIGGLCRNGFGHPGIIGMVLGGLFFLGLLVVLVLLIVAATRKGGWHHPVHGNEKIENESKGPDLNSSAINAMAILNERYAKGEINQEEYLSKKSDLQK